MSASAHTSVTAGCCPRRSRRASPACRSRGSRARLARRVPEVSLSMSTGSTWTTMLLRTLGVAEESTPTPARCKLSCRVRGSALAALLQHSTLEVRLHGGDLTVRGPAQRAVAEIRLEQALVAALPGKPVTVRVQGALNDTPAELTVSTGTLADFARDTSRVPLSGRGEGSGSSSLALHGKVALPLGRGGGDLTLDFGRRAAGFPEAPDRAALAALGGRGRWKVQSA